MHEKFIARQPILGDKLELFAHELPFRSSPENFLSPKKKPPAASS
jgi:c-di-GMP-related signal transduction protein